MEIAVDGEVISSSDINEAQTIFMKLMNVKNVNSDNQQLKKHISDLENNLELVKSQLNYFMAISKKS